VYIAGESVISDEFAPRKNTYQIIWVFQLVFVAVIIFALMASVRVLGVVEASSREFDVRVNNCSFHRSYNTNCVNGFKAELAQDTTPRFHL
jgi:hypothetical protein